MNGTWSDKWKKALILASGYTSILAFGLVGGYVIVKSECEALKKTAKLTFILSLIFAAISGALSLFYGIGDMFDGFYGSAAYDFYDIATSLVSIARVVIFGGLIMKELFSEEKAEVCEKTETEEK